MLQDCPGHVLFDSLWHHVQDVVHDGGSQLQIEVRLDALLCHSLCDALGVTSFELTREQVSEPAFEQRCDAPHEEKPDSPTWCPESTSWAFADRTLEM